MMLDYSPMDEALEVLAPYGPDLRNGLTNHAPMAVEALCALGRPDAVMPWLVRYRDGLLPRPGQRTRIALADWRHALGQADRTTDWSVFFEEQFGQHDWRDVAARWIAELAPAVCASATHGVIRVGHAVRSLTRGESAARLRELADGFGYWAACYQTLPTATPGGIRRARAADAITQVPVVPEAERHFTGTIVSSLEALERFPTFAPVIDLVDTTPAPAAVISDLTETFGRVYLANAHTPLNAIVFIHGVTSVAALRSLVPLLDAATARAVLRYAWQSSCALYAAFGSQPGPAALVEPPREDRDELIDLAVRNGDEHVIKFTEACVREHGENPSPVYFAAARHAIDMLAPRYRV